MDTREKVLLAEQYRTNTVRTVKQLMNNSQKKAPLENRKIFLLRCKTKSSFPKHITSSVKMIQILIDEKVKFQHRASNLLLHFKASILRTEIKITFFLN